MDVIVAALEPGVLLDGDEDIEIAGRTSVDATFSLAADAKACAVVDAGGNLDRELLLLPNAPRPVAVRARGLDHPAAPPALRTGARPGEKPFGGPHLAPPPARRAGTGA